MGYSETAEFASATYIFNGNRWNNLAFGNSGDIATVASYAQHYIRISMACTDTSAIIATINELIT